MALNGWKTDVIKEVGKENVFLTDETKPQFSTWIAYLHARELAKQDID